MDEAERNGKNIRRAKKQRKRQEVRSMARFVFFIIYKLLHSNVEREEGNNC